MQWARVMVFSILAGALAGVAAAQEQEPAATTPAAARQDPTIKALVDRLDLEKYKATIKGLTRFGDRRQGTDRNRAALDWIEAQLRSYGCTGVARLKYNYQPPAPRARTDSAAPGPARDTTRASGGGRYRGVRTRTGVN